MASPIILQTYPADTDTGIPVGIQLSLIFDQSIDLSTAVDSVVLFGPDMDISSGAHSAEWLRPGENKDPFFLTSPGFKGVAETNMHCKYVDLDDYTNAAIEPVYDLADEVGFGHKLNIVPKVSLAKDTEYTLFVYGDVEQLTGKGISKRTVFDTLPDVANVSDLGTVVAYGGYNRTQDDQLNIQITTSGDIGTAKYKWWYDSLGTGSTVYGQVTARRYRLLEDGVQVRFGGSAFEAGDLFTVQLKAPERLTENYKIVFNTNDGTFTQAPDSPSTPATTNAPSTVIPIGSGSKISEADDFLLVIDMDPADRDFNIDPRTRTITITFSEPLLTSTVTQQSVRLWKYPVKGYSQGEMKPVEMRKKLETVGDQIIITF